MWEGGGGPFSGSGSRAVGNMFRAAAAAAAATAAALRHYIFPKP